MRNILGILVLSIMYGCASNSLKNTQQSLWLDVDYKIELKKVIDRSPEADFLKLRMAYTNTEGYAPYSLGILPLVKGAFEKLNGKRFDECLEISTEILKVNFTSLGGQYLSMVCNFELEKNEDGEYHRYVLNGLVDSISRSRDGRSFKTAYTTISIAELKIFIKMMGLETKKQALKSSNGKAFDVMGVKDPKTGEEYDLYFDISIQMAKGLESLDK